MKRRFIIIISVIIVVAALFSLVACNNNGVSRPSGEPKDIDSFLDAILYYRNFTYALPDDMNLYMTKDGYYIDELYTESFDVLSSCCIKEGDKYYEYDYYHYAKDSTSYEGVNSITKEEYENAINENLNEIRELKEYLNGEQFDRSDPCVAKGPRYDGGEYKYIFENNELRCQEIDSYGETKTNFVMISDYKTTTLPTRPSMKTTMKDNIGSLYVKYLVESRDNNRLIVLDDGETIYFDTNLLEIHPFFDKEVFVQLSNFLEFLKLPNSIILEMSNTTALDGVQTFVGVGYKIKWQYHPDKGLEGYIADSK